MNARQPIPPGAQVGYDRAGDAGGGLVRPSLPALDTGYRSPYPDWPSVATPAAGSTASVSVDGSSWRRVVAATMLLSTDANAANRLVSLDLVDARGVTRCRNSANVVQPANKANTRYEWSRARTSIDVLTDTIHLIPLLDQWMPPGFVITFNVTNIQVGDTLTSLSVWLERWDTGPEAGGIEVWNVAPPR